MFGVYHNHNTIVVIVTTTIQLYHIIFKSSVKASCYLLQAEKHLKRQCRTVSKHTGIVKKHVS